MVGCIPCGALDYLSVTKTKLTENNDYDESDTIDNNDNVRVNIILWKLQGPVIYKRSKPNRGFTQAVGLGDSFQKVWIN